GMLSNGLDVWTVSNHEQPIVSLSLYIRGGSALDPKHREGLAASVADLLTKGTGRRSATEIAEAIDFIGGSLTASAGWDALTINISVLSKYLDVAIDLISDVIQNSTFPDEEVERMRLQRLAGIRQAKADAGFLADMVFSKLVFPSHPYGQEPIGTEHSVSEMNRDEIVRFAKQSITPSNSFLTVAGDIEPDGFRKLFEKATSSWSGPARETVLSVGDASLSARTQVGLINREGAVQSALRVGHIGIRRNTPDFIALSALNMLLGGYFNSRINLNLREVHGYTYGARSFFDTRMGAGPFAVSTEVRTEVTVRAVEEIVSEITRVTKLAVEEEELRMVKDYMIGNFPLQIETPQQVAGRVATIVLYGLERDYWDTYREKLSALTSVELYRVAREYLHPSELTITASGNVQAIEGGMAEFGEVTVLDDEGSVVETPVFI
ncbi:MAG TPA: pitrilysin family protein, partial [Candidatus Kapabacteria bacterium]|nr:pitrilysin family protein [Candidatus Kapabacteria bacterium]